MWWFNLKFVPESFLVDASWIFRSEVVLDGVTVEQFWDYVLSEDNALQQWHPECAKIEWNDENNNEDYSHQDKQQKRKAAGVERVVTYKDWPFMILLAGPIQIHEHFDIWEDGGGDGGTDSNSNNSSQDVRRFGFYFKALTRPSFLTYTGGREELKIEPVHVDVDDGGSGVKFTRIVALEPAFVVRWVLGFIAYPRLKYVFETKCPQRLVEAFQSNKFNIPKQQQPQQQK